MVDIEHEQDEPLLLAFSALYFQFQLLLEVATGAQAGEMVSEGKVDESFIHVLTGEQIFGDAREHPQQLRVFGVELVSLRGEDLDRSHHAIVHQHGHDERGAGRCGIEDGVSFGMIGTIDEQWTAVAPAPIVEDVSFGQLLAGGLSKAIGDTEL